MDVLSNPATYLLSAQGPAPATGSGFDMRRAKNYAYLLVASHSPSAILRLEVSHDNTGWILALTVTALPASAQVQISAYYPYVRGVCVTGYSTTGSAYMYYAPGVG